MLPITIPSHLYGQRVTITALTIKYATETNSDAITAILLRRQLHVCETADCYASLLDIHQNYPCDHIAIGYGCSAQLDITTNNIMTGSTGILYLTIEMNFSTPSSWVEIGGVSLRLEHD